jgi:hypothetical protein
MTATKITGLVEATTIASSDLIPIVSNPGGSPSTKKITLSNFYSNVNINVKFSNTVTLSGNTTSTLNFSANSLYITYRTTPSTSTQSTPNGKIWFDSNYIYVATATNVIKRVALTTF